MDVLRYNRQSGIPTRGTTATIGGENRRTAQPHVVCWMATAMRNAYKNHLPLPQAGA